MFYNSTKFLTSVLHIKQLPKTYYRSIEIAFAGYSNVGKSSIINFLCKNKNLAFTSKYPGKTKLINFFQVKKNFYLVDLPGYGYAKIQKKIKIQWHYAISEYLNLRKNLKGLVLIMDIRYPLKYLDDILIRSAIKNNIEIFILLNKSDKLNVDLQNVQLKKTSEHLSHYKKNNIDLSICSAYNKKGIEILYKKLNDWYKIYLKKKIDNTCLISK